MVIHHIEVNNISARIKNSLNLFSLIEKTSHIQLTGAYTHFASSDDPDTTYMHQQLNTFLDVLPKNNPLTRHAANTSALIHHPDTHLDLVRPGRVWRGRRRLTRPRDCGREGRDRCGEGEGEAVGRRARARPRTRC